MRRRAAESARRDGGVPEDPAASLLKVVAQKPVAEIDDQTLIFADVATKAVAQVRDSARELLTRTLAPDKAEELAQLLATGTWTTRLPDHVSRRLSGGDSG